jgi:hypothetical protein
MPRAFSGCGLDLGKRRRGRRPGTEIQPAVIKSATEATMFKLGDRVAIIHLHRVGKEKRREAIRIDTVEKVTPKQIVTNKAKFNAESGFQIGRSAPEYQITPLTPEHETEIKAREKLAEQQAADREAIPQKRESLHRLFPEKFAPNVSAFADGKVEIMFKESCLPDERA